MIFFLAVPFLVLGCVCFLVCATIRPLRRFALSSALWCVACVPCLFSILAAVLLWSFGVDAAHRFVRPDFGTAISCPSSIISWLDPHDHGGLYHHHWSNSHNLPTRNHHPSPDACSFPYLRGCGQLRRRYSYLLFCYFCLRNALALANYLRARRRDWSSIRVWACICLFQRCFQFSRLLSTAFASCNSRRVHEHLSYCHLSSHLCAKMEY
jgi:hypothetical protein